MKAYFKKLMGCILVLALMLSMIPVSALGADNSGVMPEEYTQESYAAEESGVESASYYFSGDFEYTVLDDGTASITDYLGSASEVIIPSTLDGYKVTTIGKRAFYECKALVNVEIPDSVTLIDDNAFFYCTKLVSVEIPDSVTEIGEYAFEGCRSLVSVKIPDSVTTIGAHSFSGCESLISIDIPDTVTDIGDYAFCGCTSLESIKIPHGITKIGDSVFSVCESLKSK